jgi:cytoskeleton protein RodZ
MAGSDAKGSDSAGARLARARVRLGLSVDQVAEKLRVERHTILALEADEHQLFGAAVFVRGFLRRYAALVGEPEAEIEALYAQRPEAQERPDLSKTGMHRIASDAHGKLGARSALLAAVALAIVGAVWWALRAKPPVTPVTSEERILVAPAAPSPGIAAPAPLAVPAAASSAAPPVAVRRHLALNFSGECWVEVYDVRGVRLFFGFGHADSTQAFEVAAPFRVVLGNVSAVAMSVEGAAVSLPPAAPGARVRFSVDADGNVFGVH